MTRSTRYAEINSILYGLYKQGTPAPGFYRMYAEEMNAFEEFCPEFDSLSDSWTEDFGPNRVNAIRKWRESSLSRQYWPKEFLGPRRLVNKDTGLSRR